MEDMEWMKCRKGKGEKDILEGGGTGKEKGRKGRLRKSRTRRDIEEESGGKG